MRALSNRRQFTACLAITVRALNGIDRASAAHLLRPTTPSPTASSAFVQDPSPRGPHVDIDMAEIHAHPRPAMRFRSMEGRCTAHHEGPLGSRAFSRAVSNSRVRICAEEERRDRHHQRRVSPRSKCGQFRLARTLRKPPASSRAALMPGQCQVDMPVPV